MNDIPAKQNAMGKREFFKTAARGMGGLCAIGLLACRRERSARDVPVDAPPNGQASGAATLSPWFTRLENNAVRCELCPKRCTLALGATSPCRVRENRRGECHTLVYGRPALVQEDPIERKPFFHVLPGRRALSISTAGCNLACQFCEVWDMALVSPDDIHSYDMPPDRVVESALAAELPAISYAFGEPTVFYEYMADTARRAKQAGLLNLMHTAAFIQPKPLREIIPLLDAVNVDLKSFRPDFYRRVVGGELAPVLAALKQLRQAGVHLEITNILIPTLNDAETDIRDMCKWIVGELGPGTPLHFARFYPLHRLADLPQTPVATLDRARDVAREEGLQFVYISRVTGHPAEHTHCPGCDQKIIARTGFIVDQINLRHGRCAFCNQPIPGRWS